MREVSLKGRVELIARSVSKEESGIDCRKMSLKAREDLIARSVSEGEKGIDCEKCVKGIERN